MIKTQFLLSLLAASTIVAAPLSVSNLRTEHEVNPIGVGTKPRLSWWLIAKDDERGKRQTSFHILAASSAEKLAKNEGDLWDSGETKDSRSHLIHWAGKPLANGSTVHWKVKVWDEKKELGEWSPTATFKVGKKRQLRPVTSTSSFECDNPKLNAIFKTHKEELGKRLNKFIAGDNKALGFGTSAQTAAREYLYHFDSTAALSHWTSLLYDGKDSFDFFPVMPGHELSGPANSDAGVLVPHSIWWMSQDQDFIKDYWKTMDNYMVAREQADQSFRGRVWGLATGDNSRSGPSTPREFIDLCYLGLGTRFMKELALPGNEPLTAIRYKDFTARLQKSFAAQYLDDQGELTVKSQAAHLLSLRSNLIPKGKREPILKNVITSLKKNGLQAGQLGTQALFPVLTFTGNLDLLVNLLTGDQKTTPPIGTGTTEWMMNTLAGIDTSFPGFQQIRINPKFPSDDSIKSVKAEHLSPKGAIKVEWKKTEISFFLDCTIPPNTLGIISLSIGKDQTLTESGKSIKDAFAAQLLNDDFSGGVAKILAQSGHYQFEIK